ncbi:DUF2141 domain-containing protein [Belliella pelovolcani]|uniref:DUF2141 domain-containing protein n=1 Tax=Belliella pelovolcani TaxID=529505 RepID=UPI00391C352E
MWTQLILVMFLAFGKTTNQMAELNLTVDKIKSDIGVIRVLVFNQENGWPDDPSKAIQSATLVINQNQAFYTFKNLPEGRYAIAVIHDTENKGKLRVNRFGIPQDGYGFSNNVTGTFGPPSFSKATFSLTTGVNRQTISLR